MTQLGFRFNADECTGCRACVVACKDVHSLPVGYKLRKVLTGEAGHWEIDTASGVAQPVGVFSYSVSYSCMHCDAPACLAKCPKGAISKDGVTGIVSIDQEFCIGCGMCAKACPWDAPVVIPGIDGIRKAHKCDLCRDLLERGEEPSCVAACSMRCLEMADVHADGGSAVAFGEALIADAPELGPNMLFLPHRMTVESGASEVRVHSMPEEYANG